MGLDPRLSFAFAFFSLFFLACVLEETKFAVHALFMGLTVTLLKKNIKNGSHGTIHIFKNYFVTVFSVFSFSKNKLYLNEPESPKMRTEFGSFLFIFLLPACENSH